MDYVGLEYSGDFGFVDTHMYWPITHMVAPKEDAVSCEGCHTQDGRMANLAGIYVPGAGINLGGKIGLAIFLMAILGALGHGLLRVISRSKGKGDHHG
jgi:hypothetical protein